MRFSKSSQIFLSLSILVFGFALSSCTGAGSSAKKPVDTDPIWGVAGKRAYYNTLSSTTANVLFVPNSATSAALAPRAIAAEAAPAPNLNATADLGQIASNHLTISKSIPMDQVQISADGTIATIVGMDGIYQQSNADVHSVVSGTVPLPPPTIDTYCNGFSLNGYTEIAVEGANGVFDFKATGANQSSVIGTAGQVAKDTSGNYQDGDFGSLLIDPNSPSPQNKNFFKASFALQDSVSPWQGLQMFCHLNNVPVMPVGPPSAGASSNLVSPGTYATCGVLNGAALCWGYNDSGGLGNASGTESHIPVQVQGLTSGVTSISVGGNYFSCGVASGSAKCWGNNGQGYLGNNSTAQSNIPVQVQGLTSGVTAISAGITSTCAIANAAAMCWGEGGSGRLGNNSTTDSHIPVQVQGLTSGVTGISVGNFGGCAIVNGAAMCWGNNDTGELGNNSTTESHIPVQVQGLTSGVTAITAGYGFACAIVNGSAMCWGDNSTGMLGNNSTTESDTPVQVQGLTSGVTSISAGYFSTCAVVNGSVQCWGYNSKGQLGNNSTTESLIPVQVSGLTAGATSTTVGYDAACAVVNGSFTCWGLNLHGQLGNNSTTQSTIPVLVQ